MLGLQVGSPLRGDFMYFIAYVKQKLKNHVSVFTGNYDQEDAQMKDSANWKETCKFCSNGTLILKSAVHLF